MSYNFMKNGVGASPPTMSRPIAKIKSQVPRADNISPRRGEKLHESGMYQKALAVSEAHAVDEEPTNGTITRKVVRQVEVPYTRKVKVPVKVPQVVNEMVEKKVPTKKMVPYDTFKEVTETYTVTEERPVVVDKEVWVKKIVKETVMQPYEVEKTRTRKVPVKEYKEVQGFETIRVPQEKVIMADSFRVDEVEETKIVEVEELQEFELQPVARGEPTVHKTRDLGRTGNRLARRVAADDHMSDADTDSRAGTPESFRGDHAAMRGSYAVAGRRNKALPGQHQANFRSGGHQMAGQLTGGQRLGVYVVNMEPRGAGVSVTAVAAGGMAKRHGVQVGDIIQSVGRTPIADLKSFRRAVELYVGGSLLLKIQRNRQTMEVQLHGNGGASGSFLPSPPQKASPRADATSYQRSFGLPKNVGASYMGP
jgi:hypothetical protein|eukprot:CAMPEP_0174302954 /NCGR_PEP_ID=MMETSP0809-20121228/59905_1 /TAXON_ID=73025 ORGANISM="Eutreptiella gymnastica-like, Strain CCMP1594" /NCGR_SAMPLE_ID=MMETSP0809 /ASSEMBLY_ACC=CAM_ASM_000658 /LENGTH=422 /DNA_ID=CAMNT_0015408901 /DNA_START=25 /DNA_END=1293 /DNA_ORIENTATION=-